MKYKILLSALLAVTLIICTILAVGCTTVESVNIPILLYHHLAEVGDESNIISYEKFGHNMDLLQENGYETISFPQLIDYANGDGDLPEKPVIITFDDGYYSNYEYAYPILEERGMKATVFAIGVSVGHMEYYKDTEHTMTPHFGETEIREMIDSGVIDIQSHTYDMHQWPPFETGDVIRENVLPLETETEAEYTSALTLDHQMQTELLRNCGVTEVHTVAYPGGKSCELSDKVLSELGVSVTVTTNAYNLNKVIKGKPDTLIALGRYNIHEAIPDEMLLTYLEYVTEGKKLPEGILK